MTFTVISPDDDGDADVIMQNLRHINYGTTLNPVNDVGVATNNTLDLGSASTKWKNIYYQGILFATNGTSFDIGGQTLTQFVEDLMLDTNATEELLSANPASATTLLNANFTKGVDDKILRIAITGGADITPLLLRNNISIDIAASTIVRNWDDVDISKALTAGGTGAATGVTIFQDWFDISGLSNGSVNVTVTSVASFTGTVRIFRNKKF